MRKFLKTTVFYGVSTAINKGLMLIALPLLGSVLNIEEYGLWTLSQIAISLGAPLISFNSAAGILREGIANQNIGYSSFIKYSRLIALISSILLLGMFFFSKNMVVVYDGIDCYRIFSEYPFGVVPIKR